MWESLVFLDLKPLEVKLFDRLFALVDDSNNGVASGKQVFHLFMTSKLTRTTLASVWNIASQGRSGTLDRHSFFVACRLVALAQQNFAITQQSLTANRDISLPMFYGSAQQFYPREYESLPSVQVQQQSRQQQQQPPQQLQQQQQQQNSPYLHTQHMQQPVQHQIGQTPPHIQQKPQIQQQMSQNPMHIQQQSQQQVPLHIQPQHQQHQHQPQPQPQPQHQPHQHQHHLMDQSITQHQVGPIPSFIQSQSVNDSSYKHHQQHHQQTQRQHQHHISQHQLQPQVQSHIHSVQHEQHDRIQQQHHQNHNQNKSHSQHSQHLQHQQHQQQSQRSPQLQQQMNQSTAHVSKSLSPGILYAQQDPLSSTSSTQKAATAVAGPVGAKALDDSTDSIWAISMEQTQTYLQYFEKADRDKDGFVNGKEAKSFFSMSKLSSNILRDIWLLADIDQDNKLNRQEFLIAMHLTMMMRMKGTILPSKLPACLNPRINNNVSAAVSLSSSSSSSSSAASSQSSQVSFDTELDAITSATQQPIPAISNVPDLMTTLTMNETTTPQLLDIQSDNQDEQRCHKESLQAKIHEQQNNIQSHRKQFGLHSQERERLDNDIKELEVQLDSITQQCTDNQQLCEGVHKEVELQRERLRHIETQIDNVSASLQESNSLLAERRDKLQELQSDEVSLNSALSELKQDVRDKQLASALVEQSIDEVQKQIAHIEETSHHHLQIQQKAIDDHERHQREATIQCQRLVDVKKAHSISMVSPPATENHITAASSSANTDITWPNSIGIDNNDDDEFAFPAHHHHDDDEWSKCSTHIAKSDGVSVSPVKPATHAQQHTTTLEKTESTLNIVVREDKSEKEQVNKLVMTSLSSATKTTTMFEDDLHFPTIDDEVIDDESFSSKQWPQEFDSATDNSSAQLQTNWIEEASADTKKSGDQHTPNKNKATTTTTTWSETFDNNETTNNDDDGGDAWFEF